MKLGIGLSLTNSTLQGVPLSERPTLDLNFALGNYTTNGFASQPSVGSTSITLPSVNGPSATFTRGNAATYRASDGYLRYAPENLLLRSQDFADSYWSKTELNFGTSSTAPDGVSSAQLLIPSTNNSVHFASSSQVSFTSGNQYTLSVYLKPSGYKYVRLAIGDTAFPVSSRAAIFYLDGAGSTPAVDSNVVASISLAENGFYRVSITATSNTTATAPSILAINNTFVSGTGSSPYIGNGGGIYIWGAQLERHSSARPYISTVANRVFGPRFEYTAPPSIEPLGLLIEEESENLLTYTEDFSNIAWLKNFVNYVGTTTAPNNTNTASTLNATSTSNVVRQAATVLASTKYVFSFYVKRGTATNLKYAIYNISGSSFIIGPTSYYSSTSNEWSRITVAFTTPVGCTSVGVYVMSDTGSTGTASFWGAQLEKKEFVTSYIPNPTTGSAVRSADYCTATLPSGLISTTQGTVVVTADRTRDPAFTAAGGGDPTVEFRDSGDALMLHYYSKDDSTEYVYFSASGELLSLGDVTTENTPFTVGWTYNDVAPELNAAINGSLLTPPPASLGLDLEPTILHIGNSLALPQTMNGHIKSIEYRPKDLTNRLQAYTA